MAVFLIIDGVEISDAEAGAYSAYEKELGVSDRMADGTRVEELRGKIWVISLTLDGLDQTNLQTLQAQLRTRREHNIVFLPPTGQTELTSSIFHLTELPQPTLDSFLDDDDDLPDLQMWSSFSVTFEEVRPHD